MVVNMNMKGLKEGNINQYLADTISNVFEQVYTVDVPRGTNRELYASNNNQMLDIFQANVDAEEDMVLSFMMEQVADGLIKYNKGEYLLTDDKAPVELLGMQLIDELISDEVTYYKKIYDEGGLEALINSL